jgi:hypothetical protein
MAFQKMRAVRTDGKGAERCRPLSLLAWRAR